MPEEPKCDQSDCEEPLYQRVQLKQESARLTNTCEEHFNEVLQPDDGGPGLLFEFNFEAPSTYETDNYFKAWKAQRGESVRGDS